MRDTARTNRCRRALSRLIVQVRPQPPFHLLQRQPFAQVIVQQLVRPEFADPANKLVGLGVSGVVGVTGPVLSSQAFRNFAQTGSYPDPSNLLQFPLGYVQRKFPNAYAEQSSLEVENEIAKDLFISVGYQFIHGLKLPVYSSINGIPNGTLPNGLQTFVPADKNFGFALEARADGQVAAADPSERELSFLPGIDILIEAHGIRQVGIQGSAPRYIDLLEQGAPQIEADRRQFKGVGQVVIAAVEAEPVDDGDLLDTRVRGILLRMHFDLDMVVQPERYAAEAPLPERPIGAAIKIRDPLRPEILAAVGTEGIIIGRRQLWLEAAAERGLVAYGYEINPLLCIIAWLRCRRYGKRVRILWRNFWLTELPVETKAVFVFAAGPFMKRLAHKFERELNHRTVPFYVASYGFTIPGITPVKQAQGINVYCYRAGDRAS